MDSQTDVHRSAPNGDCLRRPEPSCSAPKSSGNAHQKVDNPPPTSVEYNRESQLADSSGRSREPDGIRLPAEPQLWDHAADFRQHRESEREELPQTPSSMLKS